MAIIKSSKQLSVIPKKQELFSDITTNFSTISGKRDIDLFKNEDAVKTAIKNILLTDRGERFFNPTYGSDIKSILFEPIGPAAEVALKNFIITAIENFEPRANLLEVIVNPLLDENSYYISITFSVINNREPIQLELLLNRVR